MRGSITSSFTFDLSASHRRVNQALTWAPMDVYGSGAGFQPIYRTSPSQRCKPMPT